MDFRHRWPGPKLNCDCILWHVYGQTYVHNSNTNLDKITVFLLKKLYNIWKSAILISIMRINWKSTHCTLPVCLNYFESTVICVTKSAIAITV